MAKSKLLLIATLTATLLHHCANEKSPPEKKFRIIRFEPQGDGVSIYAPITVEFSSPPTYWSAVINPTVPLVSFRQNNAVIFEHPPFSPNTEYEVRVTGWSFEGEKAEASFRFRTEQSEVLQIVELPSCVSESFSFIIKTFSKSLTVFLNSKAVFRANSSGQFSVKISPREGKNTLRIVWREGGEWKSIEKFVYFDTSKPKILEIGKLSRVDFKILAYDEGCGIHKVKVISKKRTVAESTIESVIEGETEVEISFRFPDISLLVSSLSENVFAVAQDMAGNESEPVPIRGLLKLRTMELEGKPEKVELVRGKVVAVWRDKIKALSAEGKTIFLIEGDVKGEVFVTPTSAFSSSRTLPPSLAVADSCSTETKLFVLTEKGEIHPFPPGRTIFVRGAKDIECFERWLAVFGEGIRVFDENLREIFSFPLRTTIPSGDFTFIGDRIFFSVWAPELEVFNLERIFYGTPPNFDQITVSARSIEKVKIFSITSTYFFTLFEAEGEEERFVGAIWGQSWSRTEFESFDDGDINLDGDEDLVLLKGNRIYLIY